MDWALTLDARKLEDVAHHPDGSILAKRAHFCAHVEDTSWHAVGDTVHVGMHALGRYGTFGSTVVNLAQRRV